MAAIEVIAEAPAPTLQQIAFVPNDRRPDMLQAFFGGWVVLALFTFLLLQGMVVKARQWDKALSEQLKGIKKLEDWALKAFIFIDTSNKYNGLALRNKDGL